MRQHRRPVPALLALALALVSSAPASAATMFFIRGGGDGHGIGLSQYGAYGYALHGKSYRFILAHYYKHTKLGSTNPQQVVRVLLSTGAASFSGASRAPGKHLNPSLTYSVRPNADGSLTLIASNGRLLGPFAAPLSVSGPGPLALAGQGSYRGALEFRPASGGVETVEAVALDDYVRGVISKEIPASWAPEALKAQAVAARTYAITTNVGGGAFDLYRDTRSQMYGGVAAETPSTDAAVAATRGQIVTYKGMPAVTYFFNSSGGHTENIENVWHGSAPKPWLKGVPDPYDDAGGDPYHHWGSDMTIGAAQSKLGGLVKGTLIGIRVTRHGSSWRVLSAEIVGTGGTTSVSGDELQHIFGLLTTYAGFTTIETLRGPPAGGHSQGSSTRGQEGAQAVVALVPIVHNLVANTVPELHGSIFPAPKHRLLVVQKQERDGWRTVTHTRVSSSGSYSALLPGSGTYRVVYHGMHGPAITL